MEKKNLHLARFFFLQPSIYSRGSGTEATPTDARGNRSSSSSSSSSIFRAAFSSPEGIDVEERLVSRYTRSFDAKRNLEASTMDAPIFIEMRRGYYARLIGTFHVTVAYTVCDL